MPGWHVFNDFLVRPITEEEALSFPGTWKVGYAPTMQVEDSKTLSDGISLLADPRGAILPARGRSGDHRLREVGSSAGYVNPHQ